MKAIEKLRGPARVPWGAIQPVQGNVAVEVSVARSGVAGGEVQHVDGVY